MVFVIWQDIYLFCELEPILAYFKKKYYCDSEKVSYKNLR